MYDAMITETAFVDCENTPAAMVGRFDDPWNFIGEVKTNHSSLRCYCEKCNRGDFQYSPKEAPFEYNPIPIVDMPGYLFVTTDMIEVMVYFGVCRDCDSVYWARSGPPFRRAKACVPSSS